MSLTDFQWLEILGLHGTSMARDLNRSQRIARLRRYQENTFSAHAEHGKLVVVASGQCLLDIGVDVMMFDRSDHVWILHHQVAHEHQRNVIAG